MSPVICQKHGRQSSRVVCQHLHGPIQLDQAYAGGDTYEWRVTTSGEAAGLWDRAELLCEACARAVGNLERDADTLESLSNILEAGNRVTKGVPACELCIAAFQGTYGPPRTR